MKESRESFNFQRRPRQTLAEQILAEKKMNEFQRQQREDVLATNKTKELVIGQLLEYNKRINKEKMKNAKGLGKVKEFFKQIGGTGSNTMMELEFREGINKLENVVLNFLGREKVKVAINENKDAEFNAMVKELAEREDVREIFEVDLS